MTVTEKLTENIEKANRSKTWRRREKHVEKGKLITYF